MKILARVPFYFYDYGIYSRMLIPYILFCTCTSLHQYQHVNTSFTGNNFDTV